MTDKTRCTSTSSKRAPPGRRRVCTRKSRSALASIASRGVRHTTLAHASFLSLWFVASRRTARWLPRPSTSHVASAEATRHGASSGPAGASLGSRTAASEQPWPCSPTALQISGDGDCAPPRRPSHTASSDAITAARATQPRHSLGAAALRRSRFSQRLSSLFFETCSTSSPSFMSLAMSTNELTRSNSMACPARSLGITARPRAGVQLSQRAAG
mmetsp:Transcript_8676/g.27272  ORF Transcript_8676/g.27272 Transcript_8676/m.27272 type:complete len:215 (+) Transcript_8676:166-810(+)